MTLTVARRRVLVPAAASGPVSMALALTPQASDNFNRANATLAGANNWLATFDGSMLVNTNEAKGATVAPADSGDYRTETYTSDQYSQVAIGTVLIGANDSNGVTVRNSASGNANYLAIYYTSGTPFLGIFKRTGGGSYSSLYNVGMASNNLHGTLNRTSLTTGDVLTLIAIGGRLVLMVNGIPVVTVPDTAITGGAPGILTAGVPSLDNWVGGNASTPALPANTATDNFNRADGNMSAGQAGWHSLGGLTFTGISTIDPTIVSNQLVIGGGTHNAAIRTETYHNDQFAGIEIGLTPLAGGSGGFVGVLLRSNGTTSGYLCCQFDHSDVNIGQPTSYRIYRLDSGVSTFLTGCPCPADATGTQITGVVQGNRISIRGNGVEICAATDSTYASGVPGIMCFPPSTADNYFAGSL